MKSFKQFTKENYSNFIKGSVGYIVLKIRNLETRINNESNPVIQNNLIAQQNKLLGYISGIGIGASSKDRRILSKMKSFKD